MPGNLTDFGHKIVQVGKRVGNPAVYLEVSPVYRRPLRKCIVQELWAGGEILLPYTVGAKCWLTWIRDYWLCMGRANRY
jgi:hypothetical protein